MFLLVIYRKQKTAPLQRILLWCRNRTVLLKNQVLWPNYLPIYQCGQLSSDCTRFLRQKRIFVLWEWPSKQSWYRRRFLAFRCNWSGSWCDCWRSLKSCSECLYRSSFKWRDRWSHRRRSSIGSNCSNNGQYSFGKLCRYGSRFSYRRDYFVYMGRKGTQLG